MSKEEKRKRRRELIMTELSKGEGITIEEVKKNVRRKEETKGGQRDEVLNFVRGGIVIICVVCGILFLAEILKRLF